jgi:hypothetical protein
VDADRVLSDLEFGTDFNDLEIYYWTRPDELRVRLQELFVKHLGLRTPEDTEGFNKAVGLTSQGWSVTSQTMRVPKFCGFSVEIGNVGGSVLCTKSASPHQNQER